MNVALNLSGKWKNISEISLLGCIHDLDKHQEILASVGSIEDWTAALKKLTGFYALIKHEDDSVFAAVDHIRSRPLFYAVTKEGFYLSDTAEWVRQQVNDTVMDEYAKAEFQLTGYVTGQDTLYKTVKQLQAGECLVYAGNELEVERYYSFDHSEPEQYDEKALLDELDAVAKESIQRLINYANGRQIVIPLSGGYDSRLIVSLLKEACYENIFTFTYGVKGNKEAGYSRIVADSLGLKWHFVEYTEALWQAAWQTEERKRYQLEGSNWTSLAHMQDWLAVKIMKEQGVLEKNAVFAPGHSGDMVAGSHIPGFVFEDLTAKYTKEGLVKHLFFKHYCLAKRSNVPVLSGKFKDRIEQSLVLRDTYSPQEFANECERYNWQNRQAKYIVNSVQVYEFFGFDWWLPLWDKDFVGFFEDLPLELRNQRWYVEYVKNKFNDNVDRRDMVALGNAANSGLVGAVSGSRFLRKVKLRGVLRFIYHFAFKSFVAKKEGLLINSAQCAEELKGLKKKGYLMNGVTVYFFLKEFDPCRKV